MTLIVHEIVSVVLALNDQYLVSLWTSIANEIEPSGSGIDRIQASVCLTSIAIEMAPSGSGVDSSRNDSRVLTSLVRRI